MKSVIVLMLVVQCAAGGTPEPVAGSKCDSEPRGRITAFVRGETSSSVVFTAAVERQIPRTDGPAHRYVLREASGVTRELSVIATEPVPGLEVGKEYRFRVDYKPGWPGASGLLVSDNAGLLYAALTDQEVGRDVLTEGVPGFSIALRAAECRSSRPHNSCFDSMINLPVEVRSSGDAVVLYHGESKQLGDYVVSVLTAQDVIYNKSCKDAGVPRISLTIHRR